MTEPARPKPFFTRGRVIAVAVLVLVIMTVMGWCGWMLFGRYEGPLAVVFDRFEQRQTQSGWMAKVWLTNISNTATCRLHYPRTFGQPARFFARFPQDEVINVRTNPFSIFYGTLTPHTSVPMYVSLPADGSAGWLAVAYTKPNRPWPSWMNKGVAWWERHVPPSARIEWGVGREKVVCPRKLPDGTVEPPRLLSAPGAKPHPKNGRNTFPATQRADFLPSKVFPNVSSSTSMHTGPR